MLVFETSFTASTTVRLERVSPHILKKKNCCDLNLGESLCIVTFFLFSDSGLRDTENQQFS